MSRSGSVRGFGEAKFTENPEFDGARGPERPSRRFADGWTTRAAQPAEEEGWLYVGHDEESSGQPAEVPGEPRATANDSFTLPSSASPCSGPVGRRAATGHGWGTASAGLW